MTQAVAEHTCPRCGVAVEDTGPCVDCYDAQVDMPDDMKARRREYMRAYRQQPEVKARLRAYRQQKKWSRMAAELEQAGFTVTRPEATA